MATKKTKGSEDVKFWPGNIVVAEAAVAAGCNFFGGYPITPSSEVAHHMAYLLPRNGGHFIQMEDEIGAMGSVIGASLAGAKAMTATSGPGFSLKLEHLGFGYMVEAPCVVVNVMRGGPSTGLPTHPAQADVMQARWGTHGGPSNCGNHTIFPPGTVHGDDSGVQPVRTASYTGHCPD